MDKKIVAYSLLAHINNQSSSNSGFEGIFVPLVKRSLAKMCSGGQLKGDNINDIRNHLEELYGLNMPDSVLKKILIRIEKEINTTQKSSLKFYSEGSFIIEEYVFDEYEEDINKRNEELERLQRIYSEFLKAEGKNETDSIYLFVEQNKFSLGKYIHKKYPNEAQENTDAARFVNFIKPIKELYSILQSVYIGSIISSYLEYQPIEVKKSVELVLDTNFIISLLDLNTSNSASNCIRLLEISGRLGYKFTVLAITLKELDQLLKSRVDYFDTAFLSKQVDPEDIFNACERRGLTKTDLDHIRNNIVSEIEKLNIIIITNTDKYENKAKFSTEFEKLKGKRNTSFAALHDATCIEYVKDKRGKPIYDYDKVNCWFVNNSSSRSSYYSSGVQPYTIKGEDLLNLLWLTSPMVHDNISADDFSSIGLSRIVSATLDDSLPNAMTIRKLDDNLQKYAKGNISDEDVVRVAKGIAERTIKNLDSLNVIAENDSKKFVESLQQLANDRKKKEDDYQKLFDKLIKDIKKKTKELHEKTVEIDHQKDRKENEAILQKEKYKEAVELNKGLTDEFNRIKEEKRQLENKIRNPKREKYIWNKIFKWRLKSFLFILLGAVILFSILCYVIYLNNGNLKLSKEFIESYKSNILISAAIALSILIYSGIFIKIFADKFNQSAINAFKSTLQIPQEIEELKY